MMQCADLNHNWRNVSDVLSIKFKHVSRSFVETEATLSFAAWFLQQLSLRQFALRTFDGDVNLYNMAISPGESR